MKKNFLLIAALLLMTGTTFAGGGFDFGIGPKVGYQTARLSYKAADIKSGFSNHFTAGIFARMTFGRVYLQPELLYFKTSNVFDVSVTGTGSANLFNLPTGANVNMTLTQMNLQLPVLVGFNIIDNTIITLRAEITQEGDYTSDDNMFDTKTISWGLQAGLGVDVLKRITLDINYNFGLSKIFDNLSATTMDDYFDFGNVNVDNTRQGQFLVTVGFKFF